MASSYIKAFVPIIETEGGRMKKNVILAAILLFFVGGYCYAANYVKVNPVGQQAYSPYPQNSTTYVNYGYNAQGQYVPTSYSTYNPLPNYQMPQAQMVQPQTYNNINTNSYYGGW